jgi:hypothetical protein
MLLTWLEAVPSIRALSRNKPVRLFHCSQKNLKQHFWKSSKNRKSDAERCTSGRRAAVRRGLFTADSASLAASMAPADEAKKLRREGPKLWSMDTFNALCGWNQDFGFGAQPA